MTRTNKAFFLFVPCSQLKPKRLQDPPEANPAARAPTNSSPIFLCSMSLCNSLSYNHDLFPLHLRTHFYKT